MSEGKNSEALLATAQTRKLTFYMVGCAGIAICSFGTVANLLSLAVLVKKCMRNTNTNLYLCALAVADTMVLLMSILVFLKDTRSDFESPEFLVWSDFAGIPYIYIYSHAMNLLFQVASVWLTVAFTADRYLMICHPFLAERLCDRRLVAQVVACVFICSTLYTIPRLLEHEIFTPQLPAFLANLTETQLQQLEAELVQRGDDSASGQALATQLRRMTRGNLVWYHISKLGTTFEFKIYYHLVAWLVLVVAAPFLSLAVMNAFLIRAVRRARNRGRRLSGQLRRQHRGDTNVMLIGVVLLFFVCQIPAAVMHAIWSTKNIEPSSDLANFVFQEVSNLLVVLNSAINIIPYCLFSGKFRRELVRTLFCIGRCGRKMDASLDNNLQAIELRERTPRVPAAGPSRLQATVRYSGNLVRERHEILQLM